MTRRKVAGPPSELLTRARARLVELEAAGLTEHPGGLAPRRKWLTLAMSARGLEGPEVDEALGGVEPMVDRWELGEEEPSPGQVVLLAELTGHPVSFFYQDRDPPELGMVMICSRTKQATGKRCNSVSGEIVAPVEEARRRAAARRGEPPPAAPAGPQGTLF